MTTITDEQMAVLRVFYDGRPHDLDDITTNYCRMSNRRAARVVRQLTDGGLLHRTGDRILGRPQITEAGRAHLKPAKTED